MNRHRVAALAATLAVLVAIALGFWNLGGPARQREVSADLKRSDDLRRISIVINQWYRRDKSLPPDLNAITRYDPGLRLRDPLTNASYEYKPAADSNYQLCATFALDSAVEGLHEPEPPIFSYHRAGRRCFDLDALHGRLYR